VDPKHENIKEKVLSWLSDLNRTDDLNSSAERNTSLESVAAEFFDIRFPTRFFCIESIDDLLLDAPSIANDLERSIDDRATEITAIIEAFLQKKCYLFSARLASANAWLIEENEPDRILSTTRDVRVTFQYPGNEAPSLVIFSEVMASLADQAFQKFCDEVEGLCGAFLAMGIAKYDYFPGRYEEQKHMLINLCDRDGTDCGSFPAPGSISYAVQALDLCEPNATSEIEERRTSSTGEPISLQRLRKCAALYSHDRGATIRTACRFFFRANMASDPGETALYGSMALESLLLAGGDKSDATARLQEAVAFSVARSAQERSEIKKRVREIYDVRSRFVHDGSSDWRVDYQNDALELIGRVISKEMQLEGSLAVLSQRDA